MDIPREATALYFGALIKGKGAAWVDEISLEALPAQGPPAVVIAGKVVDKDSRGQVIYLIAVPDKFQGVHNRFQLT